MNPYQHSEAKGRQLLAGFFQQKNINTYSFTTGQFDTVDGYVQHKNKNIVFEIKVRDQKYLDYPDLIIEEVKYQNLLKAAKDQDTFRYYNFIGDYLFIFKPSAFKNARTGCLRCNRTTAENNGRVDKLLRFLDKEKATVYKKVNGKWDKIK